MRSFLLLLIFLPLFAIAQKKKWVRSSVVNGTTGTCDLPGTNPSTAIPVCGTAVFAQSQVFDCDGPDMNPSPFCSSGSNFPSSRSFWYKFTCYQSGTLGFLITPNNLDDDYDWMIYDVTGHVPDDVFTDPSLIVSLNGSYTPGKTGCSTGTTDAECYESDQPYNRLANLIAGHKYLLMVTNYTNSPAGYDLSFGGGTADISDGVPPTVDHIEAGCSSIKVVFSTDIRCASVTASGSEFSITPGTNTITGVSSDCLAGFNAIRELTINLAQPLGRGNYSLTLAHGTDGNTFKNVCEQEIVVGTAINFTIVQPAGAFTAPANICIGTAANFTSTSDPLSGNTVTGYYWNFGDGTGNITSPASTIAHNYLLPGTYTVQHWITNSLGCYSDTATSTVTVSALPVPSFTNSTPACNTYSVNFTDGSTISGNAITGWSWNFGDPASGAANTSAQQNPSHVFSAAGTYTVTLNVTTDKGCSAVTAFSKPVIVNNQPQADFIVPKVCLDDTYAQFTDASVIAAPSTIGWLWDFGDANATPGNPNTSTQQNPKHSYTATGNYVVTLTTTSNSGCVSTVQHNVFVNGSFPKAVFKVTDEAALCVNKPVTITNNSTVFPGSITKLEIFWDDVNAPTVVETDNSPFAGSTYTHLYPDFNTPAFKTINIHVRAYSGGVCTSDSIHAITLYTTPKLQFTPIPDTCLLAAPYQLTQATELAGVPGTGVFTGTGVSSTGIFSPQIAGVGTHTITYTYTSIAGCSATAVSSIKVLDTVSARFTYVLPACDKEQIVFNDVSTVPAGISNASTVWDFGDGSPIETHPAGAPFSHVFPTWNTYTVKMYTITKYGCSSTIYTSTVNIHANPEPAFEFPASVCLPDGNINFINKSTIADGTESAFTYVWNFGDPATGINNSSVAKDPAHFYTVPGPFNVNLQVTSGVGCVHDTTIVLDVIHPQPKAAFTISRKTACLGEDILFVNTTDPLQGGTAAMHWNMGDNINTDLNVPAVDYIYLDTLTYKVSLYIVNGVGCNSDTLYRDMKIYPNPVVYAGPDKVVLEGTTLKMAPAVQAVEPQYLWTPNNYFKNGVNNILVPTVVDIKDDITYTLQVFGRGGCMRMDQVYIKVLKNPVIPNTFSPNGDGVNEKWEITYLKDFPNSKVQVFTRAGQKVFESAGYGTPWDGKYKGKPLPADTYYYIIEPGNRHDPLTGYITILK